MDLQKLYFKALRWGISTHPNAPTEQHRAFAAAVAQLCGDDPRRPLNRREAELMQLHKISGGPSVRERLLPRRKYFRAALLPCACCWAACRRGDAVQTSYEGMSAFYLDERFQLPGTWDFDFACSFCEPIAFGELTALHHEVWRTEPNCFDDFMGDLEIFKAAK